MGGGGCQACSIYIGGFLIFAMIITSPIVGVFVVKPALRAARFRSANCTNVYYERVGTESCSCGDECSSSFPCYRVHVKYVDRTHEIFQSDVIIHEDEQTLIHYDDCTFDLNSCDHSVSDNEATIQSRLRGDGRPGRSYTCYYDPEDYGDVIMTRKFSLAGAINALFWPNFLFLVGVVLVLGAFCCKDGPDECCGYFCVLLKYILCIPLWVAIWDRISNCGMLSSSSSSYPGSSSRSEPVVTRHIGQRDDRSERSSMERTNEEELTEEQILEMETGHLKPPDYGKTMSGGDTPFDAPPSYNDALGL